MNYPKDLEKLISYFQKLPGIGEKSAERLAIATLEFSDEEAKEFSDSIISAKKKFNEMSNMWASNRQRNMRYL